MLTQSDKPSLKVIHDQFGSPTFIPHLAEAISKLMESEAYGIYHLAGRGGASWYEWCEYFFRLMKIQTQLLPISSQEFPRVAKRPRTSVLTTIKDPPVLLPPWQQGVEEFVRALGDCHPREGGGPDT
jgi:dTDP-4-dehydrorhamnose reductase